MKNLIYPKSGNDFKDIIDIVFALTESQIFLTETFFEPEKFMPIKRCVFLDEHNVMKTVPHFAFQMELELLSPEEEMKRCQAIKKDAVTKIVRHICTERLLRSNTKQRGAWTVEKWKEWEWEGDE